MALDLEAYIESLTQNDLMSVDELETFQRGLPTESQPTDAESLARELVRARKLTKYQAAAIYQGKAKGLVFDEYIVLNKIGQGGSAVVLKAQHRRMKRMVAVKVLSSVALRRKEAVRRFYREVETAARLAHPNIVTAFDAREYNGRHCLVLEYVDGQDLSELVRRQGPLAVEAAVHYTTQAARGLEYAHAQGVVHRDVKPSNLLVDRAGTVKILDMGLALVFGSGETDGADQLTRSGQVMGTCDYMAPEQADDTHTVDHRADIYSLGCTLYRLLTGETPYAGDSLVKTLWAHQEAPIPSLRGARSDVPSQLDEIFHRMVAKRPENRLQSMTEVIAALVDCAAQKQPAAKAIVPKPPSDSDLSTVVPELSKRNVFTWKAQSMPKFRCNACGFEVDGMLFRCPQCNAMGKGFTEVSE